jgi:hypothetical protein
MAASRDSALKVQNPGTQSRWPGITSEDPGLEIRDLGTGTATGRDTLAGRLELVRRRKLACLGQAPAPKRQAG